MSAEVAMPVEVSLTVGKLDASLALLTTKDHHVIEFPTMLLPDNVKAGSIVKIQVSEDAEREKEELEEFQLLQDTIMEKYGTRKPEPPVLKIVNVTQTSCVLGWEQLDLGSAQLKSLVLYKDGVRSLMVPNPFKTTGTKISGLSVDNEYSFQLKLSTTSGNFLSDKVDLHTHKMTDMSGITACLGPLDHFQGVTQEQIEESLRSIGAKPLQTSVTIDTTHFISNDADGDGEELKKAQQSNIPIVRPEWVRACELERRIVGVRGFYVDADVSNLESYKFARKPTQNAAAVPDSQETQDEQSAETSNEPPAVPSKEDTDASSEAHNQTADHEVEDGQFIEKSDSTADIPSANSGQDAVNDVETVELKEETQEDSVDNKEDETGTSDVQEGQEKVIPLQTPNEELNSLEVSAVNVSNSEESTELPTVEKSEVLNNEVSKELDVNNQVINPPESAYVHEGLSEDERAKPTVAGLGDAEVAGNLDISHLPIEDIVISEETPEDTLAEFNADDLAPGVTDNDEQTEEVNSEIVAPERELDEPKENGDDEPVHPEIDENENVTEIRTEGTTPDVVEEEEDTEEAVEVTTAEVSEEKVDGEVDVPVASPEPSNNTPSSKNKKKKNKKKKGKK